MGCATARPCRPCVSTSVPCCTDCAATYARAYEECVSSSNLEATINIFNQVQREMHMLVHAATNIFNQVHPESC